VPLHRHYTAALLSAQAHRRPEFGCPVFGADPNLQVQTKVLGGISVLAKYLFVYI